MWVMEIVAWCMDFLVGSIPSGLCSLIGVFHKDEVDPLGIVGE